MRPDLSLDYQLPDLVWRSKPTEIGRDAKGLIFEVGYGRERRRFRVYARHASSQGVFVFGGHEWRCTRAHRSKLGKLLNIPDDFICDYAPGTEDLPPLPGQRCYQCRRLRAEWADLDSPLLVRTFIYGPKWVSHPAPECGGYMAHGFLPVVRSGSGGDE